jgi:hypothetical protein
VKLDVGPEGSIELSLVLYDKSDTLLVVIDHNEWKAGDPSLWDLESDYQFLKSGPNDMMCCSKLTHKKSRFVFELSSGTREQESTASPPEWS